MIEFDDLKVGDVFYISHSWRINSLFFYCLVKEKTTDKALISCMIYETERVGHHIRFASEEASKKNWYNSKDYIWWLAQKEKLYIPYRKIIEDLFKNKNSIKIDGSTTYVDIES